MNLPEVHEQRTQSRTRIQTCLLVLSLLVASRSLAQEASSAVYVRTDTDHTTVVSPRVRVGSKLGSATRLDAVYSADIWTSASIDIATSASKAVTEQRDELGLSAAHEFTDGLLSAAYRFSIEPDYESHGVTLGGSYDFAQKSTTLALNVSGLFDRVGRAGDPEFSQELNTFIARASGTQVLDAVSWAQLVYELGYAAGYLASPYRFVTIGPATGSCTTPGSVCAREALPDQRMRHAIALIARRAMSDQIALGASYRFYIDAWNLVSNTVEGTFSIMPARNTQLAFDYRFYTQTAARYYDASIPSLAELERYTTRDKELSPFSSHALSCTFDQTFALGADGELHLGAIVGPTLYLFHDFPAYDHLFAFEATFALRVDL